MKKKKIENLPTTIPMEIEKYIVGAKLYDTSCHSGAQVLFIDKDEGYYLKIGEKGTLEREKVMTEYFCSKGIGAKVLYYGSEEKDYLLTSAVRGDDCTTDIYTQEPLKLCDTLAKELRKLHELDFRDCPVKDKMQEYFSLVEKNYSLDNYDKSHFPENWGYSSGEEAYKAYKEGKDCLTDNVLLHGDYCLPNVILKDWKLSGFIDVGGGGVGDRHLDLFWALWSLEFNLQSNKYRERFLDVYGRDKVNEEKLKIIGAIEVFV